jgi:hypothetical protein
MISGSLSPRQDASSGCEWRNGLHIGRVAASILNKQSRAADKGWSSSLGAGRGANNSSPLKHNHVTNQTQKPRNLTEKWVGDAWTGSIWLRTGTDGRLLWMWWWTIGFHIMPGISWLSEDLLASQKGLCSMEFLICDKLNEGLFNVNTKSDKKFVLEKITLAQLCNIDPIFTKPKVRWGADFIFPGWYKLGFDFIHPEDVGNRF